MKMLIKFILLVTSFSALASACNNAPDDVQKSGYDFRNTNWGMSVDEVKAAEGLPVAKEGVGTNANSYFLRYKDISFLDYNTTLRYVFYKNHCYLATYLIDSPDEDTFQYLKEMFFNEYGEGMSVVDSSQETTFIWDYDNVHYTISYYLSDEDGWILAVRSASSEFYPPVEEWTIFNH